MVDGALHALRSVLGYERQYLVMKIEVWMHRNEFWCNAVKLTNIDTFIFQLMYDHGVFRVCGLGFDIITQYNTRLVNMILLLHLRWISWLNIVCSCVGAAPIHFPAEMLLLKLCFSAFFSTASPPNVSIIISRWPNWATRIRVPLEKSRYIWWINFFPSDILFVKIID